MNGAVRPTLAGFASFVQGQMGISTTVLPADSPTVELAFCVALEIVNVDILRVSPLVYSLAVYNLAADNVINYAQDLPGAAIVPGSDPPLAYFAYYRKLWNVNSFVSGVIAASSDEGTSNSMVVMDAAKNFTLADLQYLKTPWGRTYLGFAQRYGGIVGLS